MTAVAPKPRAGCRIRSVRPKGTDGPRLLVFPDVAEALRARALREVVRTLDAHGPDIAGIGFVVWDNNLSSTAALHCSRSGLIPPIAIPEFIKNRLLAEKIDEWSRL